MGNGLYACHLEEDLNDSEKEKNGCMTKMEVLKRAR
jgi:hypothetical protein